MGWLSLLPDRVGPAKAAELAAAVERVAEFAWWQLMLEDDPAVILIGSKALVEELGRRAAEAIVVPVPVA